MKKLRAILNKEEVEYLIYNDLDPLLAYPEYLLGDTMKHQAKLKERLETLLVEGEFVEGFYEDETYALTNYGRVIGGKKKAVMTLTHSNRDMYMVLNNNRYLFSEELPNFDLQETIKRLKELKVQLRDGNQYHTK